MKAFITVIGKDKIGIINEVTSILVQEQVNIIDITQTLLEDYFTMIMLVDLKKMKTDFKQLKIKLENKASEIGVEIKIQHEDIFNTMHKL